MGVKLMFQIPVAHLPEVQGDAHFALAHLVLSDDAYRNYYCMCSERGEYVILDNGMHELGEPMDLEALVQAASLVNPHCIIPPDWQGDHDRTAAAVMRATERYGDKYFVAPVAQGNGFGELLDSYSEYADEGYTTICLPYKTREWRLDLITKLKLRKHIKHHFLGLNYLCELKDIRHAPNAQLDTGKPFRYAQNNLAVPYWSRDKVGTNKLDMYKPLREDQMNLATDSIKEMRSIVDEF